MSVKGNPIILKTVYRVKLDSNLDKNRIYFIYLDRYIRPIIYTNS